MQNLRKQAIQKLDEITPLIHRFIDHDHRQDQTISLYGGLSGAALFLYEYSRYKPSEKNKCRNKIASIIENAFEYIGNTPHAFINYCDGVFGTLWATEFLRNKNILDIDDEYLSINTLDQLSKTSLLQSSSGNCDLLHGGFGFWAFLLRCNGIPNKQHYLELQLQSLNHIAIDSPQGRHWQTDDAHFQKHNEDHININPATSINLGLAHGISGIIILLAKTCMSGYCKEEATININKGLQFLQTLKCNDASAYRYPSRVLNGKPLKGSLAWCYGDLCVSLAFWMGWKVTGNQTYRQEALETLHAAAALDQHQVQTVDAALCHGAVGIAQIFRHFYWETADHTFLDASNKWISQALKSATFKDGYAGFKAYRKPEYGGSQPEYDLLSGITGIGLALLSFLSDSPAQWQEALQIS